MQEHEAVGVEKGLERVLVFHAVDNRPAKGERTNGEVCGLIYRRPWNSWGL